MSIPQNSKINSKVHWDEIYQHKNETSLGWYQEVAQPSVDLMKSLKIRKSNRILIVGSGSTKLVDNLLEKGFKNIIATDISKVALINLETRLAAHNQKNLDKRVKFIEDDLRNPQFLSKFEPVDLWHDRAVFHFFTDEAERDSYLKLLKSLVKKGGHVIIAVYNKQSPKISSGLGIINYDLDSLVNLLGKEFKLIKHFDYKYTQTSGNIRHYLYTAFNRIEKK